MKEQVKITINGKVKTPSPFAKGLHYEYKHTISRVGDDSVTYTAVFHDSVANCEKNKPLNKDDILHAFLMDAGSYDMSTSEKDFLEEFGYDEFKMYDSYARYRSISFLEDCYALSDVKLFKDGLKAYQACRKASEKLHNMFTDEEIEQLQKEFEDY